MSLQYIALVVVGSILSLLNYVLFFFLIVAVIRLVGALFNLDGNGVFWNVIERVINPFLQRATRPFLRGRFTTYKTSLGIFVGVLVAGLLALNVGSNLLYRLIHSITI